MADPEPSRRELRSRAEQAHAQSQTLQEQVAELAEAVAQVELDVARIQEAIADQDGALAAQARGACRAGPVGRGEEAGRGGALACVGRAEDCWPEGAT
jgi:hypothetical protein